MDESENRLVAVEALRCARSSSSSSLSFAESWRSLLFIPSYFSPTSTSFTNKNILP